MEREVSGERESGTPYRITLVHGTRARKAPWAAAGSQFRKKLRERLGGDVRFDTPKWSSRNRQFDRRAGGRKLAGELAGKGERREGERHFVICHSHGGNVAVYATGERNLVEDVDGIACMNTPFLCAVPRNIKPLMAMVLIFVLMLVLGAYISYYDKFLSMNDWWKNVLLLLPGGLVIGILLNLLWNRIQKDWVKGAARKRDGVLASMRLPGTDIPVRSIWTAGDEISTGFSVIGGLAGLPHVLMSWPVLALSWLFLYVAVAAGWLYGLEWLPDEPGVGLTTLIASVYALGVVLVITLAALVVDLFLIILPYGLSLRRMLLPLVIRVFTTPVPVSGNNSTFVSIDPASIWLSHSSYESDEMIGELARWIIEDPGSAGQPCNGH